MQRTLKIFLLISTYPLLANCQAIDSHNARLAQSQAPGMTKEQLHLCAGIPTKTEMLGKVELETFQTPEFLPNSNSSSGFSLTLPLIGAVSLGSQGYCKATYKLVDNQVVEVQYAGDTGDVFGHVAHCVDLVDHCLDEAKEAKGN